MITINRVYVIQADVYELNGEVSKLSTTATIKRKIKTSYDIESLEANIMKQTQSQYQKYYTELCSVI